MKREPGGKRGRNNLLQQQPEKGLHARMSNFFLKSRNKKSPEREKKK